MSFVLRMALRETRAAWKRLLFFFVCLAIGVGAIVAIRSVIGSVRGAMTGEARTLIGGDIVVPTGRGVRRGPRRARSTAGQRPRRARSQRVGGYATMSRPADGRKAVARMVELRGVDSAFPLYGEVRLQNGGKYSHALLEQSGILVRPELLTQLGVAVGDSLVIGRSTFVIRGVLDSEPGRRGGGFSLGPRVLVDLRGARGRRASRVRQPGEPPGDAEGGRAAREALGKSLKDAFKNRFITVRTFRSTENDLGEDLARAENYLSLVGLVILVLGGIGVSSVTRVFIEQKLKSIAILKCVGATTRHVLGIYMTEILALGLAGSLLGVLLAGVDADGAARVRAGDGADRHAAAVRPDGICHGAGPGGRAARRAAVRDRAPAARAPGSSVAAAAAGGRPGRTRLVRVAATGIVGLALVGVAAWQAGSLRVGLVVCAGFVAITLVLLGAAWLLVRLTRPLRHTRSFVLRHAAMNLDRPATRRARCCLPSAWAASSSSASARSNETCSISSISRSARTRRTCSSSTSSRTRRLRSRRFWRHASPQRRLPHFCPSCAGA